MAKNKGQNNANNGKGSNNTQVNTEMTEMQPQNKGGNQKGSTNKTKTSGAQG